MFVFQRSIMIMYFNINIVIDPLVLLQTNQVSSWNYLDPGLNTKHM